MEKMKSYGNISNLNGTQRKKMSGQKHAVQTE